MNIEPLIAELRNDPLSRGYAAMTAQQVAASLLAVDRTIQQARVVTRLDLNRYGLAAADKIWKAILAANAQLAYTMENGGADANAADVRAIIDPIITANVVGAKNSELSVLATVTVSRADECMIGRDVNWQDIEFARAALVKEAN